DTTNVVQSSSKPPLKLDSFATTPNPLLPAGGADIVVNFGVGKGIDYQGFINNYINPSPPPGITPATNYSSQLQGFLQTLTTQCAPTLSCQPAMQKFLSDLGTPAATSDAWTAFNALTPELQHVFVDQVFFSELKAGAIAGADNRDYSRGF